MKEEIKHFLSITDLSAKEIWQVFSVTRELKQEYKDKGSNEPLLRNMQMVMLFEKPSLRTKLSFDLAMNQLGGHSVYFGGEEVGLGKRESVSDVARVVSSQAHLIVARVNSHKTLEELAKYSQKPVINALSDLEHPCQVLTDLFTIWEARGYRELAGLTIGYIGDGDNNVAHSLCLGSAMMNIDFRCGSPDGYFLNPAIVTKSKAFGANIVETVDPREAVENADVVVTDTWASMGDEDEEARVKKLTSYQVNPSLMEYAKKSAIFMHCLPAHRDREVTDDVIDGPQSVVFQQAENRLHAQKALIFYLLQKI